MTDAPKTWVTTEEQFRLFESECHRLKSLWGLNGWTLIVHRCDLYGGGRAACTDANLEQREIAIWFAEEWPVEPTEELVRSVARHESAHAFLQPLATLLRKRGRLRPTMSVINAAEHEVVANLLRLLPR